MITQLLAGKYRLDRQHWVPEKWEDPPEARYNLRCHLRTHLRRYVLELDLPVVNHLIQAGKCQYFLDFTPMSYKRSRACSVFAKSRNSLYKIRAPKSYISLRVVTQMGQAKQPVRKLGKKSMPELQI